jgi:hypothetical protein
MKTKLSALLVVLLILPACVMDTYDKISNLNLDYNWYCNIVGIPVITGTIVNKGDIEISSVKLNVKMTYSDGTTYSQTITVNQNIDAGGRIEFKKWLNNPNDNHPQKVSATITNAW